MTALNGLTVVSVEHAVAVPYATRLLADLGARVIKVERPGGDFARRYDTSCGPVSSYFAWVNAGKQSVELDLKSELGADAIRRLADRADVFLCNLSPGATRRLGLDAGTLRESRPELIVAELSSYGTDGPYAHRKAYDALVQSETGLIDLTGTGEDRARTGISVADIAAGVQLQAAVLTALYHRERTGQGSTLRLALMDALAEWMQQPMLYALGTGTVPPRSGAHHLSIAPYGPFPCAGGAVHLAVQNEGQWQRLCTEVLGRPELAADPRFGTVADRVANRDELHEIMYAELAGFGPDELLERLDAADVPGARTRDVLGLAEHPQLAARDRWRPVTVSGGPDISLLRPSVDSDGWTAPPASVPDLGEDTESILKWLGYTSEQIRSLTG
ncbi:CoA transferase [Pseudonocardiaceae bacterium YIM PH 21723]|nr:CoA transferase [Pseudonocardiaceae bacterium YIM PH 21723]